MPCGYHLEFRPIRWSPGRVRCIFATLPPRETEADTPTVCRVRSSTLASKIVRRRVARTPTGAARPLDRSAIVHPGGLGGGLDHRLGARRDRVEYRVHRGLSPYDVRHGCPLTDRRRVSHVTPCFGGFSYSSRLHQQSSSLAVAMILPIPPLAASRPSRIDTRVDGCGGSPDRGCRNR